MKYICIKSFSYRFHWPLRTANFNTYVCLFVYFVHMSVVVCFIHVLYIYMHTFNPFPLLQLLEFLGILFIVKLLNWNPTSLFTSAHNIAGFSVWRRGSPGTSCMRPEQLVYYILIYFFLSCIMLLCFCCSALQCKQLNVFKNKKQTLN